jgi:hypothetical protein
MGVLPYLRCGPPACGGQPGNQTRPGNQANESGASGGESRTGNVAAVLIRWCGGSRKRVGALVLGCVATVLMGIVGCTTVTEGTATVDTQMAPAYRASVSASVSESSATSRIRESQRQRSLTARAVLTACESLATTGKNATDKVNEFVGAFNQGGDIAPTEGPAIDALNSSAETVAGSLSDTLPSDLRGALNAYVDAARSVANAIGAHASASEFNRQVDRFNDSKTKAVKACIASS